jgi:methyl-accepting chemotaxis protein
MRFRRLPSLADLPVTLKVFLAPGLILAAMLGLSVVAWRLLSEGNAYLHEINATALVSYRQAAGAKDAVHGTQIALYHLLSVAANESDPARLRQAAGPVRQAVAPVAATVATLAGTGSDAGLVADLRQELAAYQAALQEVLDTAATDPGSATMLMTGVDDHFQALSEGLERYRAEMQTAGQQLAARAAAASDRARLVLLSGCAAALALCALLAIAAARAIARPVVALTATMRALADGELDRLVPAQARRDEIGAMAHAVDVFRGNELRARQLTAEREREHAARARRQAAMDQHMQEFGSSVSGVLNSLSSAAEEMRTAAGEMMQAAHRTREHATRTTEGAVGASANLTAVAAGVEQMSHSIDEISRQVAHASDSARLAVEQATATNTKVVGLAETAGRIGNVVQLIADIAGRTNLLALNATIEAARAGEAGKGFAVVAAEVKALAAQTARATEEIGGQIAAIRSATGEAVDDVRRVGDAIGRVNAVATAIAAAVEQQAAATREIVGRVQTVAQSTGEVTDAMTQVSEVAGSADIVANRVMHAAAQIGGTSSTLGRDVHDFLTIMARGEENERRAYQRIPGQGCRATFQPAGSAGIQAEIRDISRGGAALLTSWQAEPGTLVDIRLPDATAAVAARVVRCKDGVAAMAFRQDAEMLAAVDQALAVIGSGAADRRVKEVGTAAVCLPMMSPAA